MNGFKATGTLSTFPVRTKTIYTSNDEVEIKGEWVHMEFQGPFPNDGSSSHILFVISNCFYICSYGNCSELEAVEADVLSPFLSGAGAIATGTV